ncbi:hypothetical protein ACO22_01773 [Paracoccidioides brasiliensis]|uniref:Uncharacterized protein n=1 Tax=Paracoccidioides brasiliensis TaxID=121759 RepID=A0A1D2JKQ8_PARBR|nr:hypothetical protein ACO22_01773 [Paracoccidioides brasiliensis]
MLCSVAVICSPRSFDPLRYFNDFQTASEAASNPDVSKRDHFGFGAWWRICQGMHVAERSIFLGVSRMLWDFGFGIARDAQGNEIVPDPEKLKERLGRQMDLNRSPAEHLKFENLKHLSGASQAKICDQFWF